jgi:hypothetical protein
MICPEQLLPGPLQAGLEWLAGVIEIKGELAQCEPAHLMLGGSGAICSSCDESLAETVCARVSIYDQYVMLGRLQ